MKAYDNKTALLKTVLKTVMDPPWWPLAHLVSISLQEITPTLLYCCVPEEQGLQQAAGPPSRDETRSVNSLVCKKVD